VIIWENRVGSLQKENMSSSQIKKIIPYSDCQVLVLNFLGEVRILNIDKNEYEGMIDF
jgi:hypothetical protein